MMRARSEGTKSRYAPKVPRENACLLLGCRRHFSEERGLVRIALGSGNRRGQIGSGLLRTPAI